MKKHFEKIQNRPLEERKKLATLFAIITTAIVVILWLLMLSLFKKPEIQKTTDMGLEPLKEVFDNVSQEFSNIQFNTDSLSDVSDNVQELIDSENNDENNTNIDSAYEIDTENEKNSIYMISSETEIETSNEPEPQTNDAELETLEYNQDLNLN